MESQSLNILLTNDDGIEAPGIWAAAEALADWGLVTVVAPAQNYSGYGAALPPAGALSYFPHRRPHRHPASVTAFGLAGTPATCVHAGLSGVLGGGPFDLVVSGVNDRANLGRDVFYSGTFGAALTAHLLGLPAIAISLDAAPVGEAHWDTAIWALCEVLRLYQNSPEQTPVVFNVNAPNLPLSALAGALVTPPANASCLTRYRFAQIAHSKTTLAVIHEDKNEAEPEPWTDAWAVKRGHVAITPFRAVPDLLCVMPWAIPAASIPAPLMGLPEQVG